MNGIRIRGPRAVLVAAVLTLALVAVPIGAPPAEAASYKRVYIVFPKWWGNCPNGGKVHMIQAAVGSSWSTNWDRGDDIVRARVRVGRSQSLSFNLFCKAWPAFRSYYQQGSAIIKPRSNTRTIFIGARGGSYNQAR